MKVALALVLVGGVAAAEPVADIKYAVGFVCENSLSGVAGELFADGATVVVTGGLADPKRGLTANLANLHAPASVAIELAPDKQSAWFQTTCRGQATYPHSADDCARSKAPHCDPKAIAFHASGHIVAGKAWKIDQLSFTATESNEVTLARPELEYAPKHAMPAAVEEKGDADVTKAVIAWFIAGDLSKAAATGTVLVAGSAPDEAAIGAPARKLIASWSALHMALASVDATHPGVVFAKVRYETKKKTVVELTATIFVVKEHGAWRWRIIDFTS